MSDPSSPTDNAPAGRPRRSWSDLVSADDEPQPTVPVKQPMPTESWSALSQRLDGRFRWSDGGKPEDVDAWQLAQQAMDEDAVIQLTASGFNKGGLLVTWHGLPGFVPASQLINFPQFHLKSERLRELKRRQNQPLQLKIIELDQEANRFILSERAALVEAIERESLLQNIRPGDRLSGRVTNLTDFGAFVDLGGVEGLIHLSELSWRRVTHPSDIVQPQQRLSVVVLSVDRSNERISLSRKQLIPDPWQAVQQRYQPGQLVEGVVSNVVNFGVFVLLEPELEGLIHVTELADNNVVHPRHFFEKGAPVIARVIKVDGEQRRLALSIRGLPRP